MCICNPSGVLDARLPTNRQQLIRTHLQLSRDSLQLSRVANHTFKFVKRTFRGPSCAPKCILNLPTSCQVYPTSVQNPFEINQNIIWDGLGESCGARSVQGPNLALAYLPSHDLLSEKGAPKDCFGKPVWSTNRSTIDAKISAKIDRIKI